MTTILLVVLFISQLLTFYFLILLNSKLSKYKEIEKKQEAIIREMDDAISAYLVEVKDENDRLIKEITMQSKMKKSVQVNQQTNEYSNQLVEEKTTVSTKDVLEDVVPKARQLIVESKDTPSERVIDVSKIVPKTIVANAYKKQLPDTKIANPIEQIDNFVELQETQVEQALTLFEQEVVAYHRLGMSVEEIAKKTQKGKTEIELLIKFHA